MIDFGLARRYTDEAGQVLPARTEAAFRGSTTYASLAAHDGEDLSAPLLRCCQSFSVVRRHGRTAVVQAVAACVLFVSMMPLLLRPGPCAAWEPAQL